MTLLAIIFLLQIFGFFVLVINNIKLKKCQHVHNFIALCATKRAQNFFRGCFVIINLL